MLYICDRMRCTHFCGEKCSQSDWIMPFQLYIFTFTVYTYDCCWCVALEKLSEATDFIVYLNENPLLW